MRQLGLSHRSQSAAPPHKQLLRVPFYFRWYSDEVRHWLHWVLRFWHVLSRRPFLCTREGCDQLGSYRVTGDVLRCKGYVTSTAGRVARAGDVAVTAGHGRGRDVACCVGGGHVTGDGVAGAAGLRLPWSRRGQNTILSSDFGPRSGLG